MVPRRKEPTKIVFIIDRSINLWMNEIQIAKILFKDYEVKCF